MSTGYTDKIKDGITFEEFALSCARAFGFTEATGKYWIPPPPDYHVRGLAREKRKLAKVNRTTIAEAEKTALVVYKKGSNRIKKQIKKDRLLMAQYRNMLRQVEAWIPPTSDHTEIKEFMAKQITGSIDFDGLRDYYIENPAILQTGEEWLKTQKEVAQRDIAYHSEGIKKEMEQAEVGNAWVKALRDSLICDEFGNEVCDNCKKRFHCYTVMNYKRYN